MMTLPNASVFAQALGWLDAVKTATNSLLFTLGLMFVGPICGLVLFAIQHKRRGGAISERVRQAADSVILSHFLKEYGYWWLRGPAKVLVALKVHPTSVTLGGMVVVLVGAALVGAGFLGLGGLAILLGSLSDMLDGIVARERNLTSTAGEYVDSLVDRYTDLGVYVGLGALYVHEPLALALVVAAAWGSVVVPYARAKAEALGIRDVPKGPMQRAERAVLLGFGIYLSPAALQAWAPAGDVPWLAACICALIAVLANISAVQMASYTTAALRRLNRGPKPLQNDRASAL